MASQNFLFSQVLKIGSLSLCKGTCSIAYDNTLFSHFQVYPDLKAVIMIWKCLEIVGETLILVIWSILLLDVVKVLYKIPFKNSSTLDQN